MPENFSSLMKNINLCTKEAQQTQSKINSEIRTPKHHSKTVKAKD